METNSEDQVKVTGYDDYILITATGQFTGGDETDELTDIVRKFRAHPTNKVIIDFSGTKYLSSIVIGLLFRFHEDFVETGGKIVYVGFNGVLESVLKMTKVWSRLSVAESMQEALSMVRN